MLCANDSMALGAVAALKAAGRAGSVLVGGFDNISAVQQLVREGQIVATADQHGDRLAVYGIEYALQMLREPYDASGGPRDAGRSHHRGGAALTRWRRILAEYVSLLLVLLLLVAGFGLATDHFFTITTLRTVANQVPDMLWSPRA